MNYFLQAAIRFFTEYIPQSEIELSDRLICLIYSLFPIVELKAITELTPNLNE